jgi:hypothetical protein
MDIQINKPYLNETREQIVIPVEVKKDMVVYNVSKPTTDNPIKEFKCTTERFLNLYKLTK